MSSEKPKFPGGESDEIKSPAEGELTKEEKEALCEEYADMIKLCESENVPPVELKESGPEIADFEEMIRAFEANHSLEALHLIVDLTPEEALNNQVRESARIAIGLISKKLTDIRNKTNISAEELKRITREYQRLSAAVGMINNNKVDHTIRRSV